MGNRATTSPSSPHSAPACHAAPPGTLPAPLPRNLGQIITTGDTVTVRLGRRAYSPVLRKAYLSADTTVPPGGKRTLHFEFS